MLQAGDVGLRTSTRKGMLPCVGTFAVMEEPSMVVLLYSHIMVRPGVEVLSVSVAGTPACNVSGRLSEAMMGVLQPRQSPGVSIRLCLAVMIASRMRVRCPSVNFVWQY